MGIFKSINKESLSWALYDWANSAYATTVLAVFFPLFFNEFWSAGEDTTVTTARLGIATSATGIILMILSPVTGALSDLAGSKKRYLFYATLAGSLSTASLFFVPGGSWMPAILLFSFSSLCFSGGIIFYDSLLNSVAGIKRLNFISSLGYSLGYLGGGILLALNILAATKPEMFGISSSDQAIKLSFVSVGVWWLLFSIPLFRFVQEKKHEVKEAHSHDLAAGFKKINDTLSHIRKIKGVFLFLLAYWLYIDGVDTIIRMAMDFGISIGFEKNSLITALLITQFVGFPSALLTGMLFKGEKGARKGIYFTIAVYLCVSLLGAFMRNETHFYALAVTVGLVQGGIQALSRSYFASIIPENRDGEFFGLYNMIGKFAVILGPLFIAVTGLLLRSSGFSSDAASRGGIMSVSFFFIAGGILFYMSGRTNREKS
ncbi:MAG: MFS transporter [Candidatus Delongbacteria bacterium]|nr:MFS transporter [Candidatus Delongbacteria bacterium]